MVRPSGQNVSAAEVEHVLLQIEQAVELSVRNNRDRGGCPVVITDILAIGGADSCLADLAPIWHRPDDLASQSWNRNPARRRVELWFLVVEPRGLEPLTPCLQSRCATNCAKAPGGPPLGESGPNRT